jgi:nicotinate-nucleotide pyrophosphorylase (carboxylating)
LQIVRLALAEDAGDLGDITSLATIAADAQATATFLAKADGTLAGVAVANMVFAALDATIEGCSLTHQSPPVPQGDGTVHTKEV